VNTEAPLGPPPDVAPSRGRTGRRIAGFIVGVALIGAAVWVLAGQGQSLPQAWRSISVASPWLMAAALVLPVVNLAIVSLSFWLLMRGAGRISPGEMFVVIGAAWLLNFVPMRPGLVGRVAYHRMVNGIPVRWSVWVTGFGIIAGAVAISFTLALAVVLGPHGRTRDWALTFGGAVTLTALVSVVLAARGSPTWPYAATIGLRLLDTGVWVVRYAVLFALVGAPISITGAVAITAVCQAALVIPLIGNGLGIREWAVGLTASALPPNVFTGGNPRGAGLTADLLNRGAELAVALPLGLACWAYLAHQMRNRPPEAAGAVGR
jgi:uncharacterized membrane protein YbhN (UPF0104 family)